MKRFAALVLAPDDAALHRYFGRAPDEDRLWALALLTGRRPKRIAPLATLRDWACEAAQVPDWLFEDCRAVTADQAECIALILPPSSGVSAKTLAQTISEITALDVSQRKAGVLSLWAETSTAERLLLNKLLTGSFRQTVPLADLARALAPLVGQPAAALTLCLAGDWRPESTDFSSLLSLTDPPRDAALPQPFHPVRPIERPETLGPASDWQAEWHGPGRRVQLVVRGPEPRLWASDGSLLSAEIAALGPAPGALPQNSVYEGCLEGARLILHDLLELGGTDLRNAPLTTRRVQMQTLTPLPACLELSRILPAADWQTLNALRANARDHASTGLILKRNSGSYGPGHAPWLAWPADPLSLKAVLTYATLARSGAIEALTFGLWDGNTLTTFAKTCEGLDADSLKTLKKWVRDNARDRFGPVRSLPETEVFTISFDSATPNRRQKSGVRLLAPKIIRWHPDAPISDANTLSDLHRLFPPTLPARG
jgi:DNA ligase-1